MPTRSGNSMTGSGDHSSSQLRALLLSQQKLKHCHVQIVNLNTMHTTACVVKWRREIAT